MELNFVQSSEVFGKNTLAWETEFEATGDFNLHVERNKGGDILVYQRTSGSGYAIVEEFRGMDNKPAIDLDFTSVVYPKFVKIVSESQPTYATVTSDGEITEIKAQSKEVEVTANGTINVTPDAGFAYLNSVKVMTNVPTSGEGGGDTPSEGGKSELVYYDISGIESGAKIMTVSLCQLAKIPSYGIILPPAAIITQDADPSDLEKVSEVAFDFSLTIVTGDDKLTLGQMLSQMGVDTLPRLTEEEFYTL